jgi:hypothetical protein
MMIRENTRARELIDEAGAMPFGPKRDEQLKAAIAELRPSGGAENDTEARAVALGLLAESDPVYLPGAEDALTAARQEGAETNWISLHLADAYYLAGDYGKAIVHAREVDQPYFDEQGLRWRSVKVTEILAASLLAQGDLEEGLELSLRVCGELASHGEDDEDVLMPPSELALRALDLVNDADSARARDVGYEVLQAISESIELQNWFPKSLAEQIAGTLASHPS